MNAVLDVLLFSILITCINCELLKLKSGVINGTVEQSKSGRPFHQFYSIPYAEPPVGKLRFKAPVPAKSWSGVKDASKLPPRCIQPSTIFNSGSSANIQEDCLYLNVFVPSNLFKPAGKTPVIVWIHGGAFSIGSSGQYNSKYLMDKDVILVTINYRLGVLGFFGLNDDVISGNFGLKDQALALQWVKENIAAFGGDPDKVTLMGESAGSVCVHLHMFSPLSKGLFQKAIMQSGSVFSDWSLSDNGSGESVSTAFVVVSGCWRNDSIRILKCLQSLSVEDFLTLESRIKIRYISGSSMFFKPMVESNVKNQPFLPQKPDKSTYLTNVPWITGINSGEGALFLAERLKKGGDLENVTNVDTKVMIRLLSPYFYSLDPENMENKAQKIIDFYFSSKNPKIHIALKFVSILTDRSFLHPLVKTIQSNHDRQYVYYYDHRGSSSTHDFAKLNVDLGVSHADEISLLFYNKNLEAKWTPQDKLVSKTLIKFFTEFAISGDPNGESKEKFWRPTNSNSEIEFLHIRSNNTTMEKNLLKDRYEFWESYNTED